MCLNRLSFGSHRLDDYCLHLLHARRVVRVFHLRDFNNGARRLGLIQLADQGVGVLDRELLEWHVGPRSGPLRGACLPSRASYGFADSYFQRAGQPYGARSTLLKP